MTQFLSRDEYGMDNNSIMACDFVDEFKLINLEQNTQILAFDRLLVTICKIIL